MLLSFLFFLRFFDSVWGNTSGNCLSKWKMCQTSPLNMPNHQKSQMYWCVRTCWWICNSQTQSVHKSVAVEQVQFSSSPLQRPCDHENGQGSPKPVWTYKKKLFACLCVCLFVCLFNKIILQPEKISRIASLSATTTTWRFRSVNSSIWFQ